MKHAHKVNMTFKYTSANDTDIRRLFAKVRRELKEAAKAPPANVKPIKAKKEQKNG